MVPPQTCRRCSGLLIHLDNVIGVTWRHEGEVTPRFERYVVCARCCREIRTFAATPPSVYPATHPSLTR